MRKCDKYKIRQFFAPLVSATYCCRVENGLKLRTSSKALVSKNATTWPLKKNQSNDKLISKIMSHGIKNIHRSKLYKYQREPSRGVLKKRCSEHMQQIYRRTAILKCDFNKIAAKLLKSHFSMGVSPINLLRIFRTPFPKNTSGRLLQNNTSTGEKALFLFRQSEIVVYFGVYESSLHFWRRKVHTYTVYEK